MNSLKKEFIKNGYVGSFNALSKNELKKVISVFEKIIETRFYSPLYGRTSGRDWHLVYPEILGLIKHPNVVEKLQKILGNNLMVWRSQIFDKEPGDSSLQWHQAYLFSGEEYGNNKHALAPNNDGAYEKWFDVSVWFAIDDATRSNGAVQLALGTHSRRYPVRKVKFFDSVFGATVKAHLERTKDYNRLETLKEKTCQEFIFDPVAEGVEVYTMEIQAGQFFIFNERTMHCSGANKTKRRRLAINFRVTTPDVVVYPFRLNGDFIDGEEYNISNHKCVMLSGEENYGINELL